MINRKAVSDRRFTSKMDIVDNFQHNLALSQLLTFTMWVELSKQLERNIPTAYIDERRLLRFCI